MTSLGRVRIWHDADGWGVIDSVATPGGCWAHYSTLLVAGYRSLRAGQDVTFTFEAADQDGYSFRTVEAWPSDQAPARAGHESSGPCEAYSSISTLTVDEADPDS